MYNLSCIIYHVWWMDGMSKICIIYHVSCIMDGWMDGMTHGLLTYTTRSNDDAVRQVKQNFFSFCNKMIDYTTQCYIFSVNFFPLLKCCAVWFDEWWVDELVTYQPVQALQLKQKCYAVWFDEWWVDDLPASAGPSVRTNSVMCIESSWLSKRWCVTPMTSPPLDLHPLFKALYIT